MDTLIDPSADAIWESISTEFTLDREIVRQPETEEDWTALRHHAIRIMEAADLLAMPGRRVARPGVVSENPGIELSPDGVERRIRDDRVQWAALAYRLHDAARESLQAINERSVSRLLDSGERLDAVCEQCHKVYWYPDDASKELPDHR